MRQNDRPEGKDTETPRTNPTVPDQYPNQQDPRTIPGKVPEPPLHKPTADNPQQAPAGGETPAPGQGGNRP